MIFLISISDYQMSLISISYFLTPFSFYYIDENFRNYFSKNRNEFLDKTFNFFNEFGEGQYHLIGYGLIYLYSKIRNDKKIGEFARTGIKSFLMSGITVLGLKFIIGRSRPYMNNGPVYFSPFSLNNDYQSLPSGHTIVAFNTSSHIYKYNKFLGILSYSISFGTGLARIYKDQHWFSDVLSGAVLGIIIGSNTK